MHVRDAVKKLQPYRPGQTLHDLERLGLHTGVKMGSNENPLGPSPRVMEAMRRALDACRLYPDPGAPSLREALAAHYGRRVEETMTGAGVDDLLDLVVRSMLEPGDDLVLAHPGFVRYAVAARAAGGRATAVPGSGVSPYRHDLDGMLAAIGPRTRIVVLVNPNNPTGSVFTRADFERFLDRVPPGVLTILDEAYIEFTEDPDLPDGLDYLAGEKPLLVLRTFSKIHSLAGIRVGFGFGPPDLVGYVDRARLPFNVSCVAQAAAIAALEDGDHVAASRALARRETALLKTGLEARGWTVEPTWTNFVFGETPLPGRPLADRLLHRGFILRPLSGFGLPDRFFRISHGLPEQDVEFLAALDEVARELDGA